MAIYSKSEKNPTFSEDIVKGIKINVHLFRTFMLFLIYYTEHHDIIITTSTYTCHKRIK